MKDYIEEKYSDVQYLYNNLWVYVKEAWDQITQELLNSLVDSMRERYEAAIAAEGGYTKV